MSERYQVAAHAVLAMLDRDGEDILSITAQVNVARVIAEEVERAVRDERRTIAAYLLGKSAEEEASTVPGSTYAALALKQEAVAIRARSEGRDD